MTRDPGRTENQAASASVPQPRDYSLLPVALEKTLPTLFSSGPYLTAVFDGGNAHVSRVEATHLVIHRTVIDKLRRAIEEKNLAGVEEALGHPPHGGLRNAIVTMYIPGLFSPRYQEFIGPDSYRDLTGKLESIQQVLRDFSWAALRDDNPAQQPVTWEQIDAYAKAIEYIADRLERTIPPIIIARYIADTRRQVSGLLHRQPQSIHAAWWTQLLDEVDRAEKRLEGRTRAPSTMPSLPELEAPPSGDGEAS